MLLYDDQVYVDKLLCFHVKDPTPRKSQSYFSTNRICPPPLQQHIFSMDQIIDFDEVSLQFSPSYINKSNLLYSHHYPYIYSLFHMLLYIYSTKMIDREHNQLLCLSKNFESKTINSSHYFLTYFEQ